MKQSNFFEFNIDKINSSLQVQREFDASPEAVWDAWTNPEILTKWWAPKPYQAITQSMNFSEGGSWLYYMQGPENDRHYCINEYKKIDPLKSYTGLDAFCDEKGVINTEFPRTLWTVRFSQSGHKTLVSIEAQYEKLSDLEMNLSLGFQEGFTMALGNLDEVLAENK